MSRDATKATINSSCRKGGDFPDYSTVGFSNKKGQNKQFDDSLKSQLEIIIIEKVLIEGHIDKSAKLDQCKIREAFWQHKLKTFKDYGGLNVRVEKSN